MALNLWLLGHVLLVGIFSATAYGSPQKREAPIKSKLLDEASSSLPHVIGDYDLRPLNSTSLQATWRAKFKDDPIYFRVCPLVSSAKMCAEYVTDVKSQEYRIDSLTPRVQYNVTAWYQTTVRGTHYKWAASRTPTMPPPGWVSAASSPVFSGLLMLTSLLYLMVR